MYLDSALVKLHLRIDNTDEYALIDVLIKSAESYCLAYLNRDVFIDQAALDEALADERALHYPMVIKPHHQHAMLLLIGDFYARREASADFIRSELPGPVEALLKPDRIRSV